MSDKIDEAWSAAIKEWEDRGYRVIPKTQALDVSWVTQWKESNRAILEAVKEIFGDRDGWLYSGNLFVYSLGQAELKQWQVEDVAAIKAILAKETMDFADLGQLHGRIIHLITPELRTWLQRQAPGALRIFDIITLIGGAI